MKFLKKLYYSKYSKKSYSISYVDLVIDRMFSKIKKGVYIDLGCNHPIKYNNTYLLYKRGWSGINIDSDSKSIVEFNKFRKNDHNVNALVSSEKQKIKYYFYHDRSALNTVDVNLAKKRKAKPKKILSLNSTTLNLIIDNSPFKKSKINLLSVDIENHEYEALKNFNFNEYKVDVIVVEFTDLHQQKLEIYNQSLESIVKSKIYNLLINHNYKLINWVNSDLIFARNDFKI